MSNYTAVCFCISNDISNMSYDPCWDKYEGTCILEQHIEMRTMMFWAIM
jgi:hypothetical protein